MNLSALFQFASSVSIYFCLFGSYEPCIFLLPNIHMYDCVFIIYFYAILLVLEVFSILCAIQICNKIQKLKPFIVISIIDVSKCSKRGFLQSGLLTCFELISILIRKIYKFDTRHEKLFFSNVFYPLKSITTSSYKSSAGLFVSNLESHPHLVKIVGLLLMINCVSIMSCDIRIILFLSLLSIVMVFGLNFARILCIL